MADSPHTQKTHATLSVTTNILLTLAWGAIATVLVFVITPRVPLTIALVGAALGAAGGVMQHLSITQVPIQFVNASSMLEVRNAFKATIWGKRYISWIYFSKITLAALAFALIHRPLFRVILGYIAGYMVFMFVREIITLRDSFHLNRATNKSSSDTC